MEDKTYIDPTDHMSFAFSDEDGVLTGFELPDAFSHDIRRHWIAQLGAEFRQGSGVRWLRLTNSKSLC